MNNKNNWSIKRIRPVLKAALKEDIKGKDITTEAVIPRGLKIKSYIELKQSGVIAGLKVAEEVFKIQNRKIKFKALVEDGNFIKGSAAKKTKKIAQVEGNARSILMAERTALNFLSHLSGISTLTYRFVQKIKPCKAKITDTRKTTPNLRMLEKYAVKVAGGVNHRLGLYDKVLIKDNHIKAISKTPAECVRLIKKKTDKDVEVEIKKLSELKSLLEQKPDIIMLDNMNKKKIKKAVKKINDYYKKHPNEKKPKIEASGNINLSNVKQIASSGVDYISIGSLTHSNPSLDMALRVK
jgi:nicotinate-nucleotide pyrophosphorylase (carboxylating)